MIIIVITNNNNIKNNNSENNNNDNKAWRSARDLISELSVARVHTHTYTGIGALHTNRYTNTRTMHLPLDFILQTFTN